MLSSSTKKSGCISIWQTILRVAPLLLVTQLLTQVEVDAFSMKSPFLLAAFQSKNNALSSTLTDEDATSKRDMSNDDIHASKILADDETFIKPQLDKRAYRAIELPNHLQILLVSDPKTDIEAASVHIKAGHFDDPVDRAGLAHFHEHMVFLGTEKYPEENDFESFLGRNGGTSNAYTDMEDTNFYFNVAPLDHSDNANEDGSVPTSAEERRNVSQALAGALDRFAQFFISPLFSESMVERELRAIDSEYLNGMTSDSWKQFQLLKNSANTSHPFGKFGCGNYNTLTNGGTLDKGQDAEASGGSNPRDVLIKFWEENYVAENMRVCVVGRSSLDDLQYIMESTFAKVRSSGKKLDAHIVLQESDNKVFTKEHAKYGVAAFGPSQLGKYQEIIPMVEKRSIRLLFATPPFDDPAMLAARPYKALSHILGHESPGSLHSLLLEEGYINDLASGVGITSSDFSLTSLSLPLTPKGMEHKDHVINMVWQWIALIKETVLNNPHVIETYFEECTQMSKLAFQFRENGDPTDFCSAGSEGMFDYEPSKILLAMTAAVPYDNDVVKAFLDRFTPQNCIITSYDPLLENENDTNTSVSESECSAAGQPWETEKWYQAKYRQVDISQTLMDKWSKISISDVDPRLRLPDLNSFLPIDFSLRSEDEEAMTSFDSETDYSKEVPELIMDRPGLQLWHKMDRTFKIPKTYLRLLLTSPNVYQTPRTMTLNRIFVKVLEDDLNSYIYDSTLAGLFARVVCVPSGYSVSVSGYSEKLPLLLDVVTRRMLSIIDEMKEGPDARPGLAAKFEKAKKNLLRETKNFRLDSPYDLASYTSRMLLESNVWHLNSYIAELEGQYAETDPLTMGECADVAKKCLTKRLNAVFLAMGNINESGARDVVSLIESHFLKDARPLEHEEIPQLLSLQMPTHDEAVRIFGSGVDPIVPLKVQEVVSSDAEENHAVELILQTASQYQLGNEGVALLELIGHMAYNSAFDQLRTKEQLGYVVSSFVRKTAGSACGLSVVVQSSSTLPEELETRCHAWLDIFRNELENMPAETIAMEAAAVVAQLLERNMVFRDEVGRAWGSIVSTNGIGSIYNKPPFHRQLKIAQVLTCEGFENDDRELLRRSAADGVKFKSPDELKENVLSLFDTYFKVGSPSRRVISARVYGIKGIGEFESNVGKPGVLSSYDEIRQLKQFLPHYPTAPFWIEKR